MKKRFTDCDKWDDPWYQDLPPDYKALWDYICAKCDNAGVWKVNLGLANYLIKPIAVITEQSALDFFNLDKERIQVIRKHYWHIIGFVEFQYGPKLSDKSAPHRQVLSLIESHGLNEKVGYFKPTCRHKDKDIDKDKDKEIGGVGEIEPNQLEKFNELYAAYPTKVERSKALRVYCALAARKGTHDRIMKALSCYRAHLEANSWKQAKKLASWLEEVTDWENYVEPSKEKKYASDDDRRLAKILGK